MERRTVFNDNQVYFRNTQEFQSAQNSGEMTVTVVSPEISASLERIRRQKRSKQDQKAAVRDSLAERM